MKIQILSDLHLEFFYSYQKDIFDHLSCDSDIVILAGDTFSYDNIEKQVEFIDSLFVNPVTLKRKKIIIIPGNHDYYRSFIDETNQKIKSVTREYDNITFLNNEYIEFEDCVFIGACGWHDTYNKVDAYFLNDFRYIYDFTLNPNKAVSLNRESYAYFDNAMTELKDKKIVCITHNSPLLDFIPDKYRGSNINKFFANDWSNLIIKHKPLYWISGHFHQSVSFKKYNTTFIENGYGYYPNKITPNFNSNLIINIGKGLLMTNEKILIGDVIKWKNKNTDTIEEGTVKSLLQDTVAIGNHFVSWIKKDDIDVIEFIKRGKK